MLQDNGITTNTTITTALYIGIVNSFASNIGGNDFMVIKPGYYRPDLVQNYISYPQTPISIDFRETHPEIDSPQTLDKNNQE